MSYKINVYPGETFDDEEFARTVIARVNFNTILDYWNGSNFQNGGTGLHKGLTKLRDGRYVLILGSEWPGGKSAGYTISDERALNEIIESGNLDLLKLKKFEDLKELYLKKEIDNLEITDDDLEF